MTNPSILYGIVWLSVLALYSLGYSNHLLPLDENTLFYVLASIFVVISSWLFFSLLTQNNLFPNQNPVQCNILPITQRRVRLLQKIWWIGTIFSVIYSGGFPLLSNFSGTQLLYTDYGLSSLQGLLNAILMSLSLYYLYCFIVFKNRRYLFYFLLTLVFPILTKFLNKPIREAFILKKESIITAPS